MRPVERLKTDRQTNENRTESGNTLRKCKFKREDDDVMSNRFFQTASLTLTTTFQGQRHSQFSPSASNEKCTMGRVLFMIKYYYDSRKYVTLTFDM